MKSRPETKQQRNLIKLICLQDQQTKLNFKTNDLKVSQSKPTFYGVTCAVTPLYSGGVFFSAELVQVESHSLANLQELKAY